MEQFLLEVGARRTILGLIEFANGQVGVQFGKLCLDDLGVELITGNCRQLAVAQQRR